MLRAEWLVTNVTNVTNVSNLSSSDQQQEGTIHSKCLSDRKKWWSKMCAKELVVKKSEPLVAGRHGSEVRCELWSDV